MSGLEYMGSRVRMNGSVVSVEMPSEYRDGYRVTVGWSDEDEAWIAKATGISTGSVLAHGDTKEQALFALVCACAANIDALASLSSEG